MFKSKRLVQAREAKGLTRTDLIFALDKAGVRISHPTLCRWERGSSSPNAVLLGKLAKFLGKEAGYFFAQ